MAMSFMGPIEILVLLSTSLGGDVDLVGFISGDEYWKSQNVVVSVESMTGILSSSEPTNIQKLVKQLGDDSFQTRDAAAREILATGPIVIPQLQEAAKSSDAEVATRARQLIKSLQKAVKEKGSRRLIAIRTLGELKQPFTLPLLRTLVKSNLPFEAHYARRAIAAIEGKPYRLSPIDSKLLELDLSQLPFDCGLVGQIKLESNGRKKGGIDEMFKNMGAMIPEAQRKQMVENAKKQLLQMVGQIGNVRVDSATLGISNEIGNRSGFVIVILRGQYDPAGLAKMTTGPAMKMTTKKIDGMTVMAAPRNSAEFIFASDQRLVLVFRPPGSTFSAEKMIANMKRGATKTLKDNTEIMKLVKAVNRDCMLWSVSNLPWRAEFPEVLQTFQSVSVTIKQDKAGVMFATVAAVGSDDAKVEQAIKELDAGIKQMLTQFEQIEKAQAEMAKMMKPVVELLKSIKTERKGSQVIITAHIKNLNPMMLGPMMFLGTGGLGKFQGTAQDVEVDVIEEVEGDETRQDEQVKKK